MLNMLLVTLREGIEMFLIVAIAVAYLKKTGRTALLPAVAWGTAAAVAASIVLGTWLAEVAVVPKWESLLALIAAVLGFTGVAVLAGGIAKILFFVFIVLFVVSLIAHLARRA